MSNIRFIGRLVQKLLKKKENFRIFQKKKFHQFLTFFSTFLPITSEQLN